MAYDVDMNIANDGRRLTFHVDNSIVYSAEGTTAYRGKAVSMNGNATVGLATNGEKIVGAIEVVENPDPISTKAAVHVEGIVTFVNSAGAPAVTPGAALVGGATAGDVRDVNPATLAEVAAGFGVVVQVIGAAADGQTIHVRI